MMTDDAPMQLAERPLHLLARKEMAYNPTNPLPQGWLQVSWCPIPEDSKILMMVLEAVMRDVASGADRHLDITFI